MNNNSKCIILKDPPLKLKENYCFNKFHDKCCCNVSVIWCIYDKGKKTIVDMGESRPCGINFNQTSIHAEELALRKLNKQKKSKHYNIYIWRWGKCGNIKPKICCSRCTKMLIKYNYQDKIFTFDNNNIISAIVDNPPISLANDIN